MRHIRTVAASVALCAVMLAGCSSVAPMRTAAPLTSPTPSVVVYPPPGTAAVEAGGLCQMASDTAMPLVKRQTFIDGCNSALARAAEPVTKPAMPTVAPTTPTPTLSANPCSGDALASDFHSGEEGSGNDFATIIIRNTGTKRCQLKAPVVLVGLDGAGAVDTQVLRYSTVPGLVLTATAQPVPEGQEVSPGIGVLMLAAEYRDDATSPNGLCDAHRVVPTSWRLTWPDGTTTTVGNRDPHPVLPDDGQLLTCRGQLDKAQPITSGD